MGAGVLPDLGAFLRNAPGQYGCDHTDGDNIKDGIDLGKSLRDFPGPQYFDTEEDHVRSFQDLTDMCRCYGKRANHNGRIEGDNGDGVYALESETWIELNPKNPDTDGDTFSDYDEKISGFNPLSKS